MRPLKIPAKVEAKVYEQRRDIDAIWPIILDYCYRNQKATTTELWHQFKENTKYESLEAFKQAIESRGLIELRKAFKSKGKVKSDKLENSRALTKATVKSFEEERKEKGTIFLGEMDELVKKGTVMVKQQSAAIENMPAPVQAGFLGDHLDNMKKLMAVGKDTYGLDKQVSVEDNAKYQIAVITKWDPMEAMKRAKSQSTEEAIEI